MQGINSSHAISIVHLVAHATDKISGHAIKVERLDSQSKMTYDLNIINYFICTQHKWHCVAVVASFSVHQKQKQNHQDDEYNVAFMQKDQKRNKLFAVVLCYRLREIKRLISICWSLLTFYAVVVIRSVGGQRWEKAETNHDFGFSSGKISEIDWFEKPPTLRNFLITPWIWLNKFWFQQEGDWEEARQRKARLVKHFS